MHCTYGSPNRSIPIPPPCQWQCPLGSYNTAWGDPCPGTKKYITIEDRIRIAEDTPVRIRCWCPSCKVAEYHADVDIGIVYFANLYANPISAHVGMTLVEKQLSAFQETCLVQSTGGTVYIVISGPSIFQEECEARLKRWLTIPFRCEYTTENCHEYPGILRLWEARRDHEVLLYFHSKGISRYRSPEASRDQIERLVFETVVHPWALVLWILRHFVSIEKIGPTCDKNGWIWHNVFWVRGRYLEAIERPVRTTRRHYYEDWLARKVRSPEDLCPEHEPPFSETLYDVSYADCWNLLTTPRRGHIGDFASPQQSLQGHPLKKIENGNFQEKYKYSSVL